MSIKITLEEATTNLDNLCCQTIENEEVVIINRADGKNVVLMGASQFCKNKICSGSVSLPSAC